MKKALRVLATIAVLGIGGSAAQAGPILYVSDSAGRLGTVDVATGATLVIGNMGLAMTDIAFDASGHLFGTDFDNLYSINPATAAITLIGSMGVTDANALVFGSDGTLYEAGNSSNGLRSVNTTTGATTLLGNIGFSSGGDLAFNGGSLYLATSSQLVRVGLSPVSGTLVGSFGFSNVFGLATGDDGVLYGISGHVVFSVDTTTGAGTPRSTYSFALSDAYGSSFFKEAAPAVPEPTTVGLVGLGLAATRLLRNRKRS
jgi:hypothetical protein